MPLTLPKLNDASAADALAMLRTVPAGRRLSPSPTIREVSFAIAGLGGHLRQNGDPGWLVLTRGWQRLRLMEVGWALAQHPPGCDQS